MLRAAVLVLLLANAGYYAWAQGLLRDWGLAPAEQSEPQRLEQQIQPENLRIGRPVSGDAASAPASPPAAAPSSSSATPASETSQPAPTSAVPAQAAAADSTACLQAGPFDARQTETLRTAAAALPANSWSLEPVSVASRWMVYMGRFADEDALEKKRAELRARKVAYDRPGPALEPGLSLGRFSTEEAAERALAALGTQGVRTARVVQERSDATGHVLRLPAATPALRAQAETQLRTALAGRPLRNCG